ncbi:heparin lyase I family protein [Allohahella sp. A8]|uniref:heparin lyase I family protein n=1 Tax=Allohahella sp. A8 TaxID=3141461 RepID=UPI003A80CA88
MRLIWSAFSVITTAFLAASHAQAWTVKIDCENSAAGSVLQGAGGFNDAASKTVVSTTNVVSGRHSCASTIRKDTTGWAEFGGRKVLPGKLVKGDSVWVKIDLFLPKDFDFNSYSAGNRLKFMRFHTKSDAPAEFCKGKNEGYVDWLIYPTYKIFGDAGFGIIQECQQMWREFGSYSGGVHMKTGEWQTYEMHVVFDNIPWSKGGEGLIRVWRNDKLITEITDITTLRTATSWSDAFLLFTYWNGNSPKTQTLYFDDLIITNEKPSARDGKGNPRIGQGAISSRSVTTGPSAPENLRLE